jgi:hypothetical protein
MGVLLSTYESRGEVKPTAAFAVQSPASTQVHRCAPPDIAELLALAGVLLVPIGVWR